MHPSHTGLEVVQQARHNQLFARLPPVIQEQWSQVAKIVHLPAGPCVYEPGQPLRSVLFPLTAVFSLTIAMADGESMLMAILGNEGLVGLPALMSGMTRGARAAVLSEGFAVRLDAGFVRDSFERDPAVRHLLQCYTQAFITQVGQNILCNRHHSTLQRISTCLLRILDRKHSDEVVLTHELLAGLLGIRRETVTHVAQRLQAKGALRYSRGHIHVLDRTALESQACACYGTVRRHYEQAFC
jgi:CRP-like cAMP-binding protein